MQTPNKTRMPRFIFACLLVSTVALAAPIYELYVGGGYDAGGGEIDHNGNAHLRNVTVDSISIGSIGELGSPGPIGLTTPNQGQFTTLWANDYLGVGGPASTASDGPALIACSPMSGPEVSSGAHVGFYQWSEAGPLCRWDLAQTHGSDGANLAIDSFHNDGTFHSRVGLFDRFQNLVNFYWRVLFDEPIGAPSLIFQEAAPADTASGNVIYGDNNGVYVNTANGGYVGPLVDQAKINTTFASPPALGGTAPAAGTVTNLTTTGTATINNRMSIYGIQSDAANGPNIYTYTNQDAYALYGMLNYIHGNINHVFDAYYSSGWKSSYSGSNNMLTKSTNAFYMYYANGISPGNAITWNEGWSLNNTTGKFSVKQNIDVNGGTIGTSSATGNVFNSPTTVNAFTGGTTVTAGAASSTGTFTVQETLIAGYGGKARLTSTATNTYGAVAFAFVADEAIAAGEIVMVSDSTNARVKKTASSSAMPIGVALTASGAAGDTIQVVVDGVADVIYKNGVTVTRGGAAFTSSTKGQADCSASVPTTEHWQEIGHPMVSGTGDGTSKFATILHYN